MYHTVARRLGIHTIMTIYRAVAIAVIWKPEYNIKSWNNAEYFYMNHNSNLPYPSNIVRKRCQNNEHQLNLSEPIDYICITREIMMNIVQGFIYNHAVHYGWKFNIFNSFLVSCIFRNVASIDIEVEYKNITKSIKIKSDKKRFTKRTKNIKFAVGMIVRHTRDDYSSINKHDGVIIGWHRTYQVSICPSKEIDNIEIGKYFSYFEGNFYVPNENLKEHYPEDIAALTGLLIKQ
ncbi:uncharacterized protein LOC126855599 isoform X2 [Cataglyphis hispanica]|uniref:uncharacterized protein LOC126855599 isoform X2 n=1 Tax=Cataglyphis hispanica TaxID=1086592 RepID=UPI00217FDEBC|nr:uncharacterized protein LOC126855599 isoform X2 [Cataglyphis hispanica]